MKILFISGCYAQESIGQLRLNCRSKVGVQNAPNAFQWSVIKGLSECNANYEVISFPWLPIFPARYKCLFSPNADLKFEGQKVGHMYRYCTVVGLKPLSIRWRLRNVVEKLLKGSSKDEKITLLVYSTYSFYMEAIIPLAKKYPNVRIAAIVTDLIDDAYNYESNNTILKRIQLRHEIKAQKASYRFIDKFILLTKAMEERIPEAIGRNIIMEGICDRNLDSGIPEKHITNIKTILYTGTLQKYVGIDDFVDAFLLTTNPDYRLVICGAGPSESYLKEKASLDRRIVYKGMVPREEALALQRDATLVVNPRKPSESITRFSFPSKTIEYLSSGTPMIGYQLEGIPKDYYPYFYSPSSLTKEDMAQLIDEVLSKSREELRERAILAKQFIEENKSAKKQVAKIISFIEND